MLATEAAHSDPSSARFDRAESSEARFSFHLPSGEECCMWRLSRHWTSQDVIHPTASTEGRRLSREHSQPRIGKCNCGAGGGRMWKPRLISALNHPYLLRLGDRPSQANRCVQHSREARLRRKRAVEEPFPTALRCILLRSGSRSSGEEHHGNGGQVPPPHLLLETSPRESTLQGSAADYRYTR